jgi:manganese/zinc/iron transport system ATP- binding protein
VNKPAIALNNITVTYDHHNALNDITLSIPQAKLVGIVGPNGAGKSTLLKTIIGIIRPLSGVVNILGKSYKKMYQQIAYVPQRTTVDWDFPINVFDTVMMGRYGHLGWFERPGEKDQAITKAALEKVDLWSLKDRHINELSGGQQQRVFLARALAQEAEIYLLDEPFSGVDAKTEIAILNILQELSDAGKTVIVVHHDLNTVNAYFNWIVLLNKQLIATGPAKEVLSPENIQKAYGVGKYFSFCIDQSEHHD